ncbi:2-succinyl-5-enolpyruvyl-6-hydroxy-3-cyclohexene-1-carboxylic-acid synthase [Amycolatopsis sp. NPDC021455]|uniref:2-succinyl-5-enolpyruvyl-6-hydroxy-3- cyclohexene-1-carboxylic-acid synthase n=1 Tax=Amycolatopsis sp. NPDC021455 TaxID=3154901 RepID=UPI0033DD7697
MTAVDTRSWVDDYNPNALWSRLLVEQLVAAGIRDVVLCPGGRSAAMALQIFHDPRLATTVQTDERIGGFTALGMALASGRPAAVCTTSGSAVGNLVPALLEADASKIPLVVLSCDRPVGYRGTGAWQTTDQLAICAPFVRAAVDLPEPGDDVPAMRDALREAAATLARATRGGDEGPVQLNIPFPGALCPTAEQPGWLGAPAGPAVSAVGVPPVDGPAPRTEAVTELLDELGVGPGLRGLIVAGPGLRVPRSAVDILAETTGYPVLADAASGLRRPAVRNVVCEADALVFHPFLAKTRPELIIRLGQAPVSHTVHSYLKAQDCPQLRDVGTDVPGDVLSDASHALGPVDAAVARRLGERLGPGDEEWRTWWEDSAARARRGLEHGLRKLAWGESRAVATICRAGDGFGFVHLANSMAIRNGNLHLGPEPVAQPVFANRGLNGIDGTIATFAGELIATQARGLLLIGDQAACHDLSALGALSQDGLRGCVCVVNNGGGAVFDFVACHRLPGYQEAIRHPPAVDFAGAARAFGLPFRRCLDQAQLTRALTDPDLRATVTLVEVVVPPDSLAGELDRLFLSMVRRRR